MEEGTEQEAGLVVYTEEEAASPNVARMNYTIPYRQSRAVIFHSELTHHSGRISFKPGYKNRRINLTLLFGKQGTFLHAYREREREVFIRASEHQSPNEPENNPDRDGLCAS